MSNQKSMVYAEARMDMDHAVADFIKAAQEAGKDLNGIESDICDSVCDASNRQIVLDPVQEPMKSKLIINPKK